MKKVALIIMITVIGIAASGFMLDQMLAKQGGLGYISSAIEAMKIRSAKPGMPPDQIAREAAKANKGAVGLLKTLADGASTGFGAKARTAAAENTAEVAGQPAQPTDVYIRVSENREAMLKPQLDPAGTVTEIKGASDDLASAKKVAVQGTDDGREVVGVIRDSSVEDLTAVDRINAMNIPENVRDKILENYYKTGSLPEIVVKETRKPSKAASDPDDPYNSKNY